jgi:diamine N-acetyltransferase
MIQPAAARSRSYLPRTFIGKNGTTIDLGRLPEDAGQRLIEMYLAFQPRNSFQGLPPLKDEVCVRWVRDMLADGIHIVATAHEPPAAGRQPLIGHAALFPVNDTKCELLVVVCPGFQNVGIGTELVRGCIAVADELGFERIWLPVDASNVRARHVYRKCGFEYVSKGQNRELDMSCDVHCRQPQVTFELHSAAPRVPPPCFRFPSLSPVVDES